MSTEALYLTLIVILGLGCALFIHLWLWTDRDLKTLEAYTKKRIDIQRVERLEARIREDFTETRRLGKVIQEREVALAKRKKAIASLQQKIEAYHRHPEGAHRYSSDTEWLPMMEPQFSASRFGPESEGYDPLNRDNEAPAFSEPPVPSRPARLKRKAKIDMILSDPGVADRRFFPEP